MGDQSLGDAATVRPPAGDPLLGLLVAGRYRVLDVLGEGGMGTVYAAMHEQLGKRVALKALHPQWARKADIVARFKREATTATAIRHPHIVDVTDLGELPTGAPFLVMEFLEGRPVSSLIELGPMPVGRAVRIALQICDALGEAHSKGIVHRDLKPENVFLITRQADPDFAKVLDFGISKIADGERGLTQTGATMGTPSYMSPEQTQGAKDVDGRTDIWALGVMLYEMLTGVLPFEGENYPQLLLNILSREPARVESYRPDVPAALADAVHHCLEKLSKDRFATMAEVAASLEPFRAVDAPAIRAEVVVKPGHGMETRPLGPATRAPTPETAPTPGPAREVANPTIPGRSPRNHLVGWAAGGTVIVALGAALWSMQPNPALRAVPDPPPASDTRGTAPPPPVEPRAVETITMEPTRTPPPPAEVRLRIRATPADARIYLDEVEVPNPLDAPRARRLDPVRLRIERPGYRTIEQPLILAEDQALVFELSRRSGRTTAPDGESPDQAAATTMEPPTTMGSRFREWK